MLEDHVAAVAAEVLEGPPRAPEPAATTPQEVDAGASSGRAAPEAPTEGAEQILPSPLLALLLIVFGPARIGRMVRHVGRSAYGARNSVEGSEAEPTASVAARSSPDAGVSSRPALGQRRACRWSAVFVPPTTVPRATSTSSRRGI